MPFDPISYAMGAKGGGSSGGGVLVVHSTENEAGTASVLDKTWQEIHDAAETSVVICVRVHEVMGVLVDYVSSITDFGGTYIVSFILMSGDGNAAHTYLADSATGYPEWIYE